MEQWSCTVWAQQWMKPVECLKTRSKVRIRSKYRWPWAIQNTHSKDISLSYRFSTHQATYWALRTLSLARTRWKQMSSVRFIRTKTPRQNHKKVKKKTLLSRINTIIWTRSLFNFDKEPLVSTRSTRLPSSADCPSDRNHLVVLCSESEAKVSPLLFEAQSGWFEFFQCFNLKVISLPANTCVHKYSFEEDIIVKATVTLIDSNFFPH